MNKSDPSYYSDQELLDKYRKDHDNEWLGILLERYLHLIFGVCMKYLKLEEEARDQTQQICLKVLKTLPHYQVTYFKSWLYKVARNHCLMQLRQTRKGQVVPLTDSVQSEPVEIPEEEARMQEHELQYAQLGQAMESLNDAQRKCLELFYLQNKTYQRVSEITGYSLGLVKSHIQNGKRNLRLILQRLGEGDRQWGEPPEII